MNIGLDKIYGALEGGTTYDEVVEKTADIIQKGFSERPDIDVNALSDYSFMKKTLVVEVVSAETNKEMLETVPHQNIEDMAVVYRFALNSNNDGMDYELLEEIIEDLADGDSKWLKEYLSGEKLLKEIAAELGKSYIAIKKRVAKVREEIREDMIDCLEMSCEEGYRNVG